MPDNSSNNETIIIETPEKDNSQKDELTPEKYERVKQQLQGSTKEAKRLAEEKSTIESQNIEIATDLVERDNAYLEILHSKNPALAEKVAKQFGKTYAEAIATVKGDKMERPPVDRDSLKKELLEELKQTQSQDSVKSFVSEFISKLPDEKREQIKLEYEDLAEGKTMTIERAKKYLEMTSFFQEKDKIKKYTLDSAIANGASTNLGSSGKGKQGISEEAKALAQTLGIKLKS